ncbi:MAG TPA: transcription/translation regulatory transformer protein RfaH [Noviherbaspirillum sp.]
MSFQDAKDDEPWYVVYTKRGQEFRALEQLQNQQYACYLPTLSVQRTRPGGKRETMLEPLFARYLFIQSQSAMGNLTRIRSTRGVSRLVAFGDRLATLPGDFVTALMQRPHMVEQTPFQPGERVAINSGPFAGLEGIYQAPDGEARALILVDLMRQPRKLKLAVDMLSKAS